MGQTTTEILKNFMTSKLANDQTINSTPFTDEQIICDNSMLFGNGNKELFMVVKEQ